MKISFARRVLLSAMTLGAIALAACAKDETRVRGQLIIAIQTDVPLPDEVDNVLVEVRTENEVLYSNLYGVPGQFKIPATFAVFSDNTSRPLRITVTGKKGRNIVRTLRETVTTVPKDRVVTLRMPIQWLCDSESTNPTPEGQAPVDTRCAIGQSCRAGTCVPNEIESKDLPDYKPEEIFGGGNEQGTTGTCYDTVPCMAQGSVVTPLADCTVPGVVVTSSTNIALRVPQGGICDVTQTSCFVPLDRDDSPDGWRETNGTIQLPTEVCSRLQSGRITGVVMSTTCPTKTAAQPTCGPWSSVTTPTTVIQDAGVPVPTLVGSIKTALGENREVCCPLMQNGQNQLVTCVCQVGSKQLEIATIDSTSAQIARGTAVTLLTEYDPTADISTTKRRAIPGDIFDGALYFLDRDPTQAGQGIIRRASLIDGQTTDLGRIPDSSYDAASVVVDAASVYTLMSTIATQQTPAEFRLLKMNRSDGLNPAMYPVGPNAVTQFVQDGAALYVAAIADQGAAPAIQRTSKLLRIDKINGATTTLTQRTSTTDRSDGRGGYFGLRVFAEKVYAIEEADVTAEQKYTSSVIRVEAAGAEQQPVVLLKQSLQTDRVENRTLGIARSSLYTFQRELQATDTKTSSLTAFPLDGGPTRIVADFIADSPSPGGAGLVMDAAQQNIFFLTRAGKVFKVAIQ